MASPAAADDCQPLPERRAYGIVSRVNVADFEASKAFYGNTLEMTCIEDFDSPPYWTEFYISDRPNASIGLSKSESTQKRDVTTVIVPDLARTLERDRVTVTSCNYAGQGVCLAFFQDPSRNELAFRQENWDCLDPEDPYQEAGIEAQCNKIIKEHCMR